MSTTSVFKVHYHFEGKKDTAVAKISPEYIDYIQAADGNYGTLKTVLSNNSKLFGGGTLVIDAVIPIGPGVVLA